ncbi:putative C-type lectin domain family 20 member A isoform X2 [Silurus meridionalis]|uniref:putative C-type lectin domain family 20 member A isoform X2 n=1 Tax=Silurus meridionalis TaxID=175797 RepID=UPI001EEA748A|nr:putative C-type lectin domain family 20 member A isoform X2 [Silurus meridionalis]
MAVMKQQFVLLLFTGVLSLVLSVPCKYHLIQQGKTWNDAQAYCRAKYIDLATINGKEDIVNFRNEAQTQKFSSSAWIGLYTNINSWHWSFTNEPLGSFTVWDNTEPNNYVGNEECVFIVKGYWYDAPCELTLSFVCFDESITGSGSYILIAVAMKWTDAQSYCRQKYTDLAIVRDATENSIIGGKNSGQWTWIGLSRDPWKCIGDVARCSDSMPFFCYSFPDQLHIIRMKVKSSQDVNDPAIMASVMKKIKQKLTDHGIMAENITVKWRGQSDGVVFHKDKENMISSLNNTSQQHC